MTPQELAVHVDVERLKAKIDESHPLIEGTSWIAFEDFNRYKTQPMPSLSSFQQRLQQQRPETLIAVRFCDDNRKLRLMPDLSVFG
jgi:hypothetical protein